MIIRVIWKLIKPRRIKESDRVPYALVSRQKMIFICGYPRSGSTYLYQKFCETGTLSYVTNLGHFLAHLGFKWDIGQRNYWTTKESHTGYIKGLYAPSEADSIFRQYFGFNKDGAKSLGMHKNLSHFNILKKDWVFAWNAALFYHKELTIMFPKATFIIIDRPVNKIYNSWLLACKRHGQGWGISATNQYNDFSLEESIKERMRDINKEIRRVINEDNVRFVDLSNKEDEELFKAYKLDFSDYR